MFKLNRRRTWKKNWTCLREDGEKEMKEKRRRRKLGGNKSLWVKFIWHAVSLRIFSAFFSVNTKKQIILKTLEDNQISIMKQIFVKSVPFFNFLFLLLFPNWFDSLKFNQVQEGFESSLESMSQISKVSTSSGVQKEGMMKGEHHHHLTLKVNETFWDWNKLWSLRTIRVKTVEKRGRKKWNQEFNSLLSFQKLEFRGHEFSLGLERNFRE